MAKLRTDYKDQVLNSSVNTQRKFRQVSNSDGTISLTDATSYAEQGDTFGAGDINNTNAVVNTCIQIVSWDASTGTLVTKSADYEGQGGCMIHNGAEMQRMELNGVEVQTWIHNGVQAYNSFTPFYVVKSGSLVDGNYVSAKRVKSGTVFGDENRNYGLYVYANENNATAGYDITFKTNKAEKLTFNARASWGNHRFYIYGDGKVIYTIPSHEDRAVSGTIDISNYSEIRIYGYAQSYYAGMQLEAYITEIYCHK